MKKFIKIFAAILALLLVLIIAAPFIFKDKIISIAKDEINKNLNAKVDFGAMDLSVLRSFPNLSLSIENLSVVGKDFFAGDTLLSLPKMSLTLDIMSVIRGGRMDIKSILLVKPRIKTIVLKNGKANWDITKADSTEAAPQGEPSKFHLALKKFGIEEGYVVYDDRQGSMKAILAGLNHELSGDFTQDIFNLETLTTMQTLDYWYGGIHYLKNAATELRVTLGMDMMNSKYSFKENVFKINALEFGLDGWVAMPKEDIEMDLKFIGKKASFKDFLSIVPGIYTAEFKDVKTAGNLSFTGYAKGKYSEKTMPQFGLQLSVSDARFQYPSLPKSVEKINIDVNLNCPDGKPDNLVTDIRKFNLEIAGNPFSMKMIIRKPESDPNIDGNIKTRIDLGSIREAIPMEKSDELNGLITADISMKGALSAIEKEQYQNFDARGNASIENMKYRSSSIAYPVSIKSASMDFSPAALELRNFESKIGESDLSLKGKLSNYLAWFLKDEALEGKVSLNSNRLNLNELMGPEEEPPVTGQDTGVTGIIQVPANIGFEADANIRELIYDNLRISQVRGVVKLGKGSISLNDLDMQLMGGSMNINGTYSTANPEVPQFDFRMQIKDFDIPETYKSFVTVQKLSGAAKYARGKFSTGLSIGGMLDKKMEPVFNTLSGDGRLQTSGVIISNYPMFVQVAEKLKLDQFKAFPLKDVNISFKFKNGRVNIEPFDIMFGDMTMNLGGSSGFNQSLDYNIKMDIPRARFGGAANNALNSLVSAANSKGANFSLSERIKLSGKVTGSTGSPKLDLGLKEAAGNMADDLKQQALDLANQKKAELEAKAREEADKLKAEADKKKQELESKTKAEADKIKAEAEKKRQEAEAKAKAEAERLKAEADKKKQEAEKKAKEEAEKKLKKLWGK
ncbi:MAG: hypothetical protein RLZZ46_1768 [Bacteroidota bacterium]